MEIEQARICEGLAYIAHTEFMKFNAVKALQSLYPNFKPSEYQDIPSIDQDTVLESICLIKYCIEISEHPETECFLHTLLILYQSSPVDHNYWQYIWYACVGIFVIAMVLWSARDRRSLVQKRYEETMNKLNRIIRDFNNTPV